MKVLAYFLGTFPQLTETFVLREIEALRARRFDVRVFAVRRSDLADVERSLCDPDVLAGTRYARPDGVWRHLVANLRALLLHPRRYLRALRVFVRDAFQTPPAALARRYYHFYCGIGFAYELRRLGIDHVHCHFNAATNMALAAHLYSSVHFSFSAHASGDIYMHADLLEEKLRYARFVVTVCEYNRRYLDGVTGYRHSDKLRVVYNGIDAEECSRLLGSVRRTRGADRPGELRIVSVGSLIVMKGHDTLIEACALLRDRKVAVECVIVGEGPQRSSLERLIVSRGLGGSVHLRGARPLREVYEALANADVFVLLSQVAADGYRDGFPTVILEAMVVGLPVVSTWISGTPEMVLDGVSGLLVHERDPEAAAAVLERLAGDPAYRRALGAAGRRRVLEEFPLERSADRLAGFFEAVPDDAGRDVRTPCGGTPP